MPRRKHVRPADDPFAVLGLARDSTLDDIEVARRVLAKSAHPDVGGSVHRMQVINAAADEAARIAAGRRPSQAPQAAPSPAPPSPTPPAGPSFQWRVDHPSFTVEALPAESFEALLVVANWLGE